MNLLRNQVKIQIYSCSVSDRGGDIDLSTNEFQYHGEVSILS